MTATLALLACLAAHPDRCQRFELAVEGCALPTAAYAAAMQWMQEHPGWTLRRVGPCERGRAA